MEAGAVNCPRSETNGSTPSPPPALQLLKCQSLWRSSPQNGKNANVTSIKSSRHCGGLIMDGGS